MKSLALDTYVLSADVIVPLLDRAYTPLFSFWPPQRDPRVSRALEPLRTWDRRSAATSVAFTYLYFWGKAYEDLYSAQSFGRFTGYARRNIKINSWLEHYRARRALEAALERMQKLFGKTEVPWGQVNVTIRGGTFPMDGTGLYDVLHPDVGPEQSNGQIFDNDGWGHLMIVMEGDPKEYQDPPVSMIAVARARRGRRARAASRRRAACASGRRAAGPRGPPREAVEAVCVVRADDDDLDVAGCGRHVRRDASGRHTRGG